ncbi:MULTISPECIES: serine ammonia-lyase [Bacillus]|nr:MULTISPECIES: serine ammonia-lyase [Bacillus]MCP1166617.1 serine ammonia-lyase [Bacillus sp. 1813sda1]MDC7973322.1 serine ammonia-lyase [Bacillus sp. BLCC-B18]
MFLGMMTRLHEGIFVQDIGIDNKKMSDRLAVRIASGFVDRTLEPFLNGVYTASNNYLYKLLKELIDIDRKDYMQKTL